MVVIVPMAGRGSRLSPLFGNKPKPLIEVAGKPIFHWALKSVEKCTFTRILFICLKEHERKCGISGIIKSHVDSEFEISFLDHVTGGQLCTVMEICEKIKKDEDILIISSDTYVVSDISNDIKNISNDCRGLISVADMPGDRWSFAKTDKSGNVRQVAEKIRISDHASTGMYYFSSGREFVEYGNEILVEKKTTSGEYYVIQAYEKYLEDGKIIGISKADKMWDMGNIDSLNLFKEYLSSEGNRNG